MVKHNHFLLLCGYIVENGWHGRVVWNKKLGLWGEDLGHILLAQLKHGSVHEEEKASKAHMSFLFEILRG